MKGFVDLEGWVVSTKLKAHNEGFRNRFFTKFHWDNSNKDDFVRLEVFTAVTMKNGVFCYVTPCGSCKNRRLRELSASFIQEAQSPSET
jgi:hypothetical protein